MRIRDRQTCQAQHSGPQSRERTTRGHGSRKKVPRLCPKCRWSRPTQKQSRNSIETSSCRQETRGDKNRVTTHEAASDSLPFPDLLLRHCLFTEPSAATLVASLIPPSSHTSLAWQRAGTRYDDARLLDDRELSNCPSGHFRARGPRDTFISLLSRIISLRDTDRHVSRPSPDKYPPRSSHASLAFTLPNTCPRVSPSSSSSATTNESRIGFYRATLRFVVYRLTTRKNHL